MKIIVPHRKTKQEAIGVVDRTVTEVSGASFAGLEFVNPSKSWDGDTMTFSMTGKLGFITIPISGTAVVDDHNVTLDIELPPMFKNLIGEDKVRAGVEEKIKGLLNP